MNDQIKESFLFEISEEDAKALRKQKRKLDADTILNFIQDYNEMIGHRQKEIKPRTDLEWEL